MKASASPNIAFIKYWGKLPAPSDEQRNLATNASLSMTLSKARTDTWVDKTSAPQHEILINGAIAKASDQTKVSAHIMRVLQDLSVDPEQKFRIDSRNNFPQGTGIASSASAFAALTLGLVGECLGAESARQMLAKDVGRLSRLARRGSGSASRSLEGGFVKWDGPEAHSLTTSWKLYDTILIFSEEPKSVPSSEGHKLATSSPLFEERLKRVPKRLAQIEGALSRGDFAALGPVLEIEALELHEIARSSTPSVNYLTQESRKFVDYLTQLNRSRDFYFTLDAGPNIHLISEHPIQGLPEHFEKAGIKAAPRIWSDEMGTGASLE